MNAPADPRRSPSMHDSHDGPAWSSDEAEQLWQQFWRLEKRVRDLEAAKSSPPVGVDVRGPNRWRIRASSGIALVLALAITISIVAWEWSDIAATFGRK